MSRHNSVYGWNAEIWARLRLQRSGPNLQTNLKKALDRLDKVVDSKSLLH